MSTSGPPPFKLAEAGQLADLLLSESGNRPRKNSTIEDPCVSRALRASTRRDADSLDRQCSVSKFGPGARYVRRLGVLGHRSAVPSITNLTIRRQVM